MKTIYTLLLALLVTQAAAQNRKLLPEDYAIPNIEKSGIKPHTIEKRIFDSKGNELACEPVTLPPGDYTMQNNRVIFEFSINQNGLLHGEGSYVKTRQKGYHTTLQFDNGMLVKAQTEDLTTATIYSQVELKDSLLTATQFYPSGKPQQVIITDFRIKEAWRNSIRTSYYESGQVEVVDDKIKDTFSTFFENGKPERFSDDKNGISNYYNEDGSIESKSYNNGDESCRETYSNGKIDSKECFGKVETKTYTYKAGKLQYICIYNNETYKQTYVDANGKPIVSKIPQPSVGIDIKYIP